MLTPISHHCQPCNIKVQASQQLMGNNSSSASQQRHSCCLRCSTARRGQPDSSTPTGASTPHQEVVNILHSRSQRRGSRTQPQKDVNGNFIPQHGRHFRDLWQPAITFMQHHLKQTVDAKIATNKILHITNRHRGLSTFQNPLCPVQ
jgi:hypothetical protein